MNIIAVVGTMVPDSRLRHTIDVIADEFAETVQIIEANEYDFGNFDPTLEEQPSEVKTIREQISNADIVVIGTPLYNASISGPTKNIIDAFERHSLDDTDVGFVVVSGGQFPRTAAEHLSTIIRSLGGRPISRDMMIPNVHNMVDGDGEDIDEVVYEKAEKFVEELRSGC